MKDWVKWLLDVAAIMIGVILAELALNAIYGNRGEHKDGSGGALGGQ